MEPGGTTRAVGTGNEKGMNEIDIGQILKTKTVNETERGTEIEKGEGTEMAMMLMTMEDGKRGIVREVGAVNAVTGKRSGGKSQSE